jgi:mRNA interferase RelE/StbE
MPFAIYFHEKAAKELNKLDKPARERIKKEIEKLSEYAEKGKHLKHCNFWSLRIGDYRAIYEINKQENKIIILFIGHRKSVYEDFTKLF